jgi:ankyrin repeat protein
MYAVANDHAAIVACLLDADAQVNLADNEDGDTALIQAARSGRLDILQMLVKHAGVDVDKIDQCGETALFNAARRKNPAFVATLLDAGADMTVFNRAGDTALKAAIGRTRVAVIEIFLLHGAQLDVIDCYPPVPSTFSVAIADLYAERATPGRADLEPEDPHVYFSHLISTLQKDGSTQDLLHWLPSQGVRMACAQLIAADLHAAWRFAPGGGVDPQQRLTYTLSALSLLSQLDAPITKRRVRQAYQAAGISDAAIERLAATACAQLDKLCRLAAQVMAKACSAMQEKLIPRCLAAVTLNYRVDSLALMHSLVSDGYCVPVAQDIALSWQAALEVVQEKSTSTIIPAGLTIKQLLHFVMGQTALHAPAPFARALQGQLAGEVGMTQPGQSNNEAPHGLLQVQRNQLRRFCAQLL